MEHAAARRQHDCDAEPITINRDAPVKTEQPEKIHAVIAKVI